MRLLCWSHHSTSEYKKGPLRLSPGPIRIQQCSSLPDGHVPNPEKSPSCSGGRYAGVGRGSRSARGARQALFRTICGNHIIGSCPDRLAGLMAAASQECSSVGRASVSKTEGPRFESVHSCHFSRHRWICNAALAVSVPLRLFPPLQGEGDQRSWWRGVTGSEVRLPSPTVTPLRQACGLPPPLLGEE